MAHRTLRNDGQGHIYRFRLVFGSAMIASIAIGFVAIRRPHIARRRACAEWLIRGRLVPIGLEPRRTRTAGAGGS